MNTVPQIKDYYEAYWSVGRKTLSGSNQGYARNFRRWMAGELEGLAPGVSVIDVGCGDASFTVDLARFSPSVTAIDISAGQIEENARLHPGIRFLQHDLAERLPFDDGSFGVVWCSEVLEHLFNPAFALLEMHRVLRPGGRLLVTVPYHGTFKNLLIALFNWERHFTPSNPHIRFYTKRTLGALALDAGFRTIGTDACGMGIPLRDLFVPTNILMVATKGPAEAP